MTIPSYIQNALHLLNEHGYEAYVVGGSVRDSILEIQPNDWDITTSATPDEILSVFSFTKCLDIGKKHGTITVLLEKEPVEITTYRIDGTYSDSRHPDSISFSKDIYEDLARRDFTMNAIAYNEKNGIVDPYGGQKDIKDHLIKCVGNSDQRFKEDALRVLRGLRLSSQLGFQIDDETVIAMNRNKELLKNISSERIYSEMSLLLCGQYVTDVLCQFPSIFSIIIPELKDCIGFEQQSSWHCYTVYKHIAKSVSQISADPVLRWTMLLHDIAKPSHFILDDNHVGHFYGHPLKSSNIAKNRLKALHADNYTIQSVSTLIKEHDTRIPITETSMLKLLNRLGYVTVDNLIRVQHADHMAQSMTKAPKSQEYEDNFIRLLNDIREKGLCFTLKDLAITGQDCIDIGIEDGIVIGNMLQEALNAVIEHKCRNKKDELLTYLKEKAISE